MFEPTSTRALRCAIYTRKSSEEGLEQSFNSLHAQREACEAFIVSQTHEGWRPLQTVYDDGGFTGGNLQRPGMQKLLEDIRTGQIDVVVVYKVDRLTRSLSDFARIVEVFDTHKVSFVSITQAFNTTTSMGRLTLNVLLSFAQFEREVTGERIRDKIAASKAKGMWMGGLPPLGYDAQNGGLVVNEAEADSVRALFRLFRDLKNVDALRGAAAHLGIVSKRRALAKGDVGGVPMSRGNLYHLLKNPIYVGEVSHRGRRHPGLHQGIVDPDLFQDVEALLATNRRIRSTGERMIDPSLLSGKLFDDKGRRFTPTHTRKGTRRYRYYALMKTETEPAGARLPAEKLEAAVITAIQVWLARPDKVLLSLSSFGLDPAPLLAAAEVWASRLQGSADSTFRVRVRELLDRAVWAEAGLTVRLEVSALLSRPDGPSQQIEFKAPLSLRRRGADLKIVTGSDGELLPRPDPSLLSFLARGTEWFEEVASGRSTSFREVAAREAVTPAFVGQLVELAFLAPELKAAIMEGRQPVELTARKLLRSCPLPKDWGDQRRLLGFAS